MLEHQLAPAVVMVEPRDFGFNTATAHDNAFQHQPDLSSKQVSKLVMSEFWSMVEILDDKGVDVITLDSPPEVHVPDAVFPNNWFSTTDTDLIIYPMKTANRQAEVQIETLESALTTKGYKLERTIDLREQGRLGGILEGTGVLIFNHPSRDVFANISERCQQQALSDFCAEHDYKQWPLYAVTSTLVPIYHSNVLMSCGQDFAVIAKDTLTTAACNKKSYQHLNNLYTDVIDISEQQMVESFCGNILQLRTTSGNPIIVLSESASKGFTTEQIALLEKHGDLAICPIPNIEYIGGGSARCMIAEIFLKKSQP